LIFLVFLRPLYELQITMLFANYPRYFDVFLSCNKAYTFANSLRNAGWCGECAKCLAIFTMLYPFIGETEVGRIFRQDLFKKEELLPLMQEMIGKSLTKPFECVGTFKEMRVAFYLALKSAHQKMNELPYLLQVFESQYLPNYCQIEKEASEILLGWNKK